MVTLEELKDGKEAVIKSVQKGHGFRQRMCNMNIREGKIIKKIASQPFCGPVVVMVGDRQCAIGREMTKKITVEEL